jgi:hypothetical protein
MPAPIDAIAPRQVLVERLSLREELANVVRGSALVVVLVWMYLAATTGSDVDARRRLLPYQTLIQNRPSVDQRMFRELQEGLLEAETVRFTTGQWPAAESLSADGIPPFAPDPTAKTATYRWALLRGGQSVNYLGIPDRAGPPAWVVLVQEPQPGVPPDQLFEDEEHHRLLDGTMLHVSTWAHAAGVNTPSRLTSMPQAEGWIQIYAVSPGVAPPPALAAPARP